jgi:uncharacterized linocin/CFP29 family protein
MVNALAELGKQWDKEIVSVLQEQTIGRKLIPLNVSLSHKGLGMTEVGTNAFSARADAVIDYDITEDNLGSDSVDVTAKSLKVPVQQDDNIIPRRAYEAYKLKGVPIDASLANNMAAKIATIEDDLIIMGWTADGSNYEIKGMYQVAANSASGAVTSTYGNTLASVAAALKELWTDKVFSAGYNLVMAETNYAELIGSYSSAGIWEFTQVIEQLNINAPGKPGRVFVSPNMTENTAMVAPVASRANMRFFDLIEAQAPTFDNWIEGSQKTGPVHVRLLGALVPRFKHLDGSDTDNCICKITGL